MFSIYFLGSQNFCNDEKQFRCNTTGLCIEKFRICDGVKDCLDGSDEYNCLETCPSSDFKCHSSGKCIPMAKRCDYYKDCPGNEDEDNCSMY